MPDDGNSPNDRPALNLFGGSWTDEKLRVLGEYLHSYQKVLKKQKFQKVYIDAFAGSGYRKQKRAAPSGTPDQAALFPDLAESEAQGLHDGSPRIALKTDPGFDRYIFIEQDADRCRELEGLKTEFPALARSIEIKPGDANAEIRAICRGDWKARRAVLFLDPFGMQVEWPTIEAIAKTQAIDLWLLFPLGMGVNRLLKKTGEIPDAWRHRIDLILGTKDWYDAFYSVATSSTLFGEVEKVAKASTDVIGRYCNDRFRTVFAGVADQPGILRNSRKSPLYLLCFAAGNTKGAPIAVKIAEHLLKGVQ